MILFLNKTDLFEVKLFKVPLRVPGVRFDDFAGPYANDPGVDGKPSAAAPPRCSAPRPRVHRRANQMPASSTRKEPTLWYGYTCATLDERHFWSKRAVSLPRPPLRRSALCPAPATIS